MEYLFLRRKRNTFGSQRQRDLLFKAAEKYWERECSVNKMDGRKIDLNIYKTILYFLEIKQVFLDSKLSLKKLSAMIETNQTYVSNVVNRYFNCNLKELLNRYRVEYAKELLTDGRCPLENIPERSGFASRSAFYAAFNKLAGSTPVRYMTYSRMKLEQGY